jgi:hypothetical protein
MTTPHNSGALQLIRMIDQHGQAVPLDVRQDGRSPGLVSPGKRTRFKIRAGALAYRVNRLVLPESPEDWHVYGIYVGSQLQFSSLADSPDEDGIAGGAFSADFHDNFFSFQITQTAMNLVLDVAYHGPVEGGAPFCCHLQCTAAYANNVSLRRESELIGKWKDLAWHTVYGRSEDNFLSPAALIALVTSVDYPEALNAYNDIQQVLNGTVSQERSAGLARVLEDRERHLIDLSKSGGASSDPALALAAQSLLPAVRAALGTLTKRPEFGPTVDVA